MAWALEPINIQGQRVRIRNYDESDFAAMIPALHDPTGWFGTHWGINHPDKVHFMLRSLLESQAKCLHNALVYLVGNEVAGITRLMRLEPANKSLEIGGTMVSPKWRKTFVNTEVKYLLLQHCFESLGAERVEFRVDARNLDSQRAVLRLGAKLEGRMRNRQLYQDGVARDGFLFSVVRQEWNNVKEGLEQRMTCPSFKEPLSDHFPTEFKTDRLLIRKYQMGDASELVDLVERNRADLVESFPITFQEVTSLVDAESYILNKLHQWLLKNFFSYAVIEMQTGRHIGQLHLKNIRWDLRSVELGYFLDSHARRKGFGSELVQLITETCLKEHRINRIFLRILPTNEPSLNLAKKLGFEFEGLHRKEFMTGSHKIVDVCYFSRTADQNRYPNPSP